MKKIFIVLVIMCLASVYSCNTKQEKSITTSDSTQVLSPSENLVRFFLKYKSYDANEVKEQMLIEKRDAELKLIESNRKKEIKAKAKKQLELQGKIESYELYGDILYRGKIYTVKSRTDIENFLKQIHDGIF